MTGGEVQLSGVGVDAKAEVLKPGEGGGTQAFDPDTGDLAGLLGDESVEIQSTVELKDVAPEEGARSAETPSIELRAPSPGEEMGQMLLVKDEAGVLTWHFAQPTRGLGDERTYVIDRRVFVAPQPDGTRGLGSAVASKLLNVVVFPLIDPVAGKVADYFAGSWEAKKRPYRLRWSTPDDFTTPGGTDVQPADWDRLHKQRALLLVHGTFSRSHSGFGRLPRETFEELHRHYEGRVVALDHFTLSHTPRENVEWLLAQIPDGRELELDIVCHSRGGLVARTLAERQSELSLGSRRLSVGRVVFVASPNAGTTLADADHLGDLIDLYTNLLNFIPDNGVTDILPCIVTVVKMIAVGAVKGLDGLTAMAPGGDFLLTLNAGAAPEGVSYRALAADSEPGNAGFAAFARDALMDRIFKAGNDLVVPTDGVFAENGAGLFPIADTECHVFKTGDGVSHTTFFSNRATQEKLKEWLIGG
jgi:pimeloyl-ACP methyl ester carboxylesterase